jgi:hypothetical protein
MTQTQDSFHENQNYTRRFVAGVTVGTSILFTLGLMSPFVFTRSPLPFMSTPRHKVRRALEKATRNDKSLGSRTFVDLGSGDGEAVYQALKVGYGRAIGVELNFTLYLWSTARRWLFWSQQERKRSRFYHQNMFDYNLREASTVMIFGVKPLMLPISRKLAQECESRTLVLSYRFVLPIVEPGMQDQELLRAALISDDEEMRVYEVL